MLWYDFLYARFFIQDNMRIWLGVYIYLLSFSLSAQQCLPEDYVELTDTALRDEADAWCKQSKVPHFEWGTTSTRYAKWRIPSELKGKIWKTRGWRGERVNAQAVLYDIKDLKDVRLQVSDLKCGRNIIPSEALSTYFVRYVMTDELNKDGKGGCGDRSDRTAWDSSLVADPLDIIEVKQVKACTVQPIWLTVQIPQNTPAGIYKGTLGVFGSNLTPLKLSVQVEVLDRVLPDPKDWKFHLDLWQNPYAVARYHKVPLWSKEHFKVMLPLMKRLACAGQKVITATIMHKPWNGQTQDPFNSMVGKTKRLDGSWSYDYTVFDNWVNFMMKEVGIDKQINCYTLIPWNLQFDYYDQASNSVKFLHIAPGDREYTEYWMSFLVDFARHLKAKGWFDKTTIAMDERGLEAMKIALKIIKQADPEFKVSLAGYYHPEIEALLYDYCLPFGYNFPPNIKQKREKNEWKSTVYTCCTEAKPNLFTFSSPEEATWLGWHVAANGFDGYLRWAYNSWTEDPLRDSRFHTWAAGDCYLTYPGGRSSIRMEKLIEGIQDYEKIWILRNELEGDKKRKLDHIVTSFATMEISVTNMNRKINNARRELNLF